MRRMFILTAATSLALGAAALGQAADPQPPATSPTPAASELAESLTRRVGESLGVKTVVGQPVTTGSVTLIPILMIEVNFGGAGLVLPSGPPGAAPRAAAPQASPADGFLMSGEARPLGFVVVTKQGTRFISLTSTAAK